MQKEMRGSKNDSKTFPFDLTNLADFDGFFFILLKCTVTSPREIQCVLSPFCTAQFSITSVVEKIETQTYWTWFQWVHGLVQCHNISPLN